MFHSSVSLFLASVLNHQQTVQQKLQKHYAHVIGINFVAVDHFYKDKTITKISFAEFTTLQAANVALEALGGRKSNVNGMEVRKATRALNLRRNWHLREAQKMIGDSHLSVGKNVSMDMTERTVKVNGDIVFSQTKN